MTSPEAKDDEKQRVGSEATVLIICAYSSLLEFF